MGGIGVRSKTARSRLDEDGIGGIEELQLMARSCSRLIRGTPRVRTLGKGDAANFRRFPVSYTRPQRKEHSSSRLSTNGAYDNHRCFIYRYGLPNQKYTFTTLPSSADLLWSGSATTPMLSLRTRTELLGR